MVDWLLSMLVRDKRLSSQWEKPSQESAVSSRLAIKRWEDRPILRELFLELMAVFLLQSNLKREFSRPSSVLRFKTLRLSLEKYSSRHSWKNNNKSYTLSCAYLYRNILDFLILSYLLILIKGFWDLIIFIIQDHVIE